MSEYEQLLTQHLKKELPERFPEKIIERTVKTFDTGKQMNKADYETAPLIAKGLAEYIKNQYNPSQSRGARIEDPEAFGRGEYASVDSNGLGANLMTEVRENAKGTRFEENTDEYWPSNANTQYGYIPGTAGYVMNDEPNTANLSYDFTNNPDTVGHEFEHTRPAPMKGNLVNLAVMKTFVEEGQLPANALADNRELMAALVGRESSLPSGKSLNEDPVFNYVLNTPEMRDWFLKNRFRK